MILTGNLWWRPWRRQRYPLRWSIPAKYGFRQVHRPTRQERPAGRSHPGPLRGGGPSSDTPVARCRHPGLRGHAGPSPPDGRHPGGRKKPAESRFTRGASSHRGPHQLGQELNDLDGELRQTIQNSPVWREKDDSCAAFPVWGHRCPWHCWPICLLGRKSQPWSVWRHSPDAIEALPDYMGALVAARCNP